MTTRPSVTELLTNWKKAPGSTWTFNVNGAKGQGFKATNVQSQYNAQIINVAFTFGPNLRADQLRDKQFPTAPKIEMQIDKILLNTKEKRINMLGIVRKVESKTQQVTDPASDTKVDRALTTVELIDEVSENSATISVWGDPRAADSMAEQAKRLSAGDVVAFCNIKMKIINKGEMCRTQTTWKSYDKTTGPTCSPVWRSC